jgi:hypothetical protein
MPGKFDSTWLETPSTRSLRSMDGDSEIKLPLTKADFIVLLDILGVAMDRMTQVQESLGVEDKSFVDLCEQLEQKILGAGMQAKDPLVQQDSLSGKWVPLESTVGHYQAHEVLHVRDEDFFWDELAGRIAELHAIRRVGTQRWEEMGEQERLTSCDKEMQWVAAHLTEFGIDRMFVVDRDPHG